MALCVYCKIYKCFYDVINDVIRILLDNINIFDDAINCVMYIYITK